ncbi:50S ribosomal protein L18 [Candidatus Atribacteria bacterium RBG_19FT_COMBO_35_14]|uniref:Large ribosomal subunit protein uL18 n=1 Tax=Candidatus Sediminicultor quintus TaxID=1797291 RepID=A0A1F5AGD7_9BACT|nr:MAG: 50S ribosomal protein L18 [Candidatus Atribacteria bacterium RBG_19FT_COMBO_35_14]OGD33099.1 MAG: 50S ribosomal protein L18 [Candidatus Atribacteria bacterium RBG_16_35_8]
MLSLAKISKRLARVKRHKRVRKDISGSSERPRLCIFRSLKHIYAQVIDDRKGITLVSLSTLNPEIRGKEKYQGNIKAAEMLGSLLAKKLEEKGIKKVVFDRGGYLYHGRVKAVAENTRKGKIVF